MSGTRGSTLIESMIAMIVFSIGALGVMRLQLESIRVNRFGGHMTQAALLAEERARTLQALDFDHPLIADVKSSNNPVSAGFPSPAMGDASPSSVAESSQTIEALRVDGTSTAIGTGESFQRYWMVADMELNAATAGADAKRIRVVTRFRDGLSPNWREVGVTVVKAKAN